MHKDWLKRKLTVEQAEAENMVENERLGQTPIPFWFCNKDWRDLLAQMQPKDELWEFSSSDDSWQHLAGRGGISLVRRGKIIANLLTIMN